MIANEKQKGEKTKILIVDDHPIIRKGLISIIEHQKDMNVCGEADNTHQAMKVINETVPDIVIVDISLKGSDGIELTKNIKIQHPKLPVMVFSIHDEAIYAKRALLAGAKAYIMKDSVSQNIITAIRTVLGGEIYVSKSVSKDFLHQIAGDKVGNANTQIDCLSDREFEVFRLISEGYKSAQMAEMLNLSVKTIETYRSRLKSKLNLTRASDLLKYAIKWAKTNDRKN